MLEFTHIPRISLKKVSAQKRIKNFKEIYTPYSAFESKEQAKRCMSCGIPYCSIGCPLHNMIPLWLKTMAQKDLSVAFDVSNSTSPFPEILGRICPHDSLCEGSCSLNTGHGAVSIGSVESFITDTGLEQGLRVKLGNGATSKTKVAIIGSGPSGISCATYLLRAGINVEMFERAPLAGGLLTYGIPNFKLDKNIVQNRIKMLTDAGMKLHTNKEITKDEFAKLYKEFDYVYLAMGATKSNVSNIDGLDESKAYKAIDYLTTIQCEQFGQKPKFDIDIEGKNVVVIGGGDTAMDCVRSSIRKKAKKVTCIYRRSQSDMAGSKKEYENAVEEGVEFVFNTGVKDAKDGKLNICKLDDNLEFIKSQESAVEFDIVVFALGFSVNKYDFLDDHKVDLNPKNGRVIVDENFKTSNDKIYGGGDIVQGASLAVIAAAHGRECAKAIAKIAK